jgi:hypothetical protein
MSYNRLMLAKHVSVVALVMFVTLLHESLAGSRSLVPTTLLFTGFERYPCAATLKNSELASKLYQVVLIKPEEPESRLSMIGSIEPLAESSAPNVREFVTLYRDCLISVVEKDPRGPEIAKYLNEVEILFARLVARVLAVGEFNQGLLRTHSRLLAELDLGSDKVGFSTRVHQYDSADANKPRSLSKGLDLPIADAVNPKWTGQLSVSLQDGPKLSDARESGISANNRGDTHRTVAFQPAVERSSGCPLNDTDDQSPGSQAVAYAPVIPLQRQQNPSRAGQTTRAEGRSVDKGSTIIALKVPLQRVAASKAGKIAVMRNSNLGQKKSSMRKKVKS